jgi:putative ABC transport system permease protein
MSPLRLIIASVFHHWRMNLAVACGVAVGTAVLTGALLVGDSMRGSLRHLALDRLGKIDEVLLADHFFRAQLAEELAKQDNAKKLIASAVPVIMLRASMENPLRHSPVRANHVELIACDKWFWQLAEDPQPVTLPHARQIVLNRPLAEKLAVKPGDEVILRLPRPGAIPADSALGRKHETVQSYRLTVSAIIPAQGLGRFGLRPTQQIPLNAFLPLDWLQERLDQSGLVNSLLVHLRNNDKPSLSPASQLQQLLRPKLIDLGLNVEKTNLGYINISSEQMILSRSAEKEILKALDTEKSESLIIQPAFTYLANTIATEGREIPYSTITAIDFADQAPLGPFLSSDGKPLGALQENEIALNTWAADDLQAKPGDRIAVTFFQPESINGQIREDTVSLRLAAVVKLQGPADDRALTPTVKGMTDESTMADWDPPFPFDAKRIRPQDEQYWDEHGAVPKAFVSLATGRRLWSSRFGQTTSIRLALPPKMTLEDLDRRLAAMDPTVFGMLFQPIKQQALTAAAGTTPFNVLFLAFSFFIIAAAVTLVLLLFRLGVEQRAGQIGILLAVGLTRRQVKHLLLAEGFVIATVGGLIGTLLGVGYAALMLLGLCTWWLAAIVTPFLNLYITPLSLLLGFFSGIIAAMVAIGPSVRSISRIAPRSLLAGQTARQTLRAYSNRKFRYFTNTMELILILLLAGMVLLFLFAGSIEEYQVVVFFVGGALMLLVSLVLIWLRLRWGRTGPAVAVGRGNILRLALRNAARNPSRSALSITLVAAACFLIVAVSAFRIDATLQTPTLHSGNGGLSLVAETDQPIYENLNTPEGRAELGFSQEDEKQFAGSTIISLRVVPGDDASCLNLYRPRRPRLLGVPQTLIDHDGFAWADAPPNCENPWTLLHQDLGQDPDGAPRLPVILEKNTANYSLNLWQGLGETFQISDGRGNKITLQVVALLDNSIFQGDLLVDSAALLKYFPNITGYRFFLIKTPPDKTQAMQTILERKLSDYGLAVETTGRRLAGFLAVQNTYLSTFQSLGGLGLLLGTFGLAVVQMRNVLERRGELALMRAAGLRRRTLVGLVLLENAVLLLAGLGCGIFAALAAVLPHLMRRDAAIPWLSLTGTLALILAVGLSAGLVAAGKILRAPLLTALREEK